MFALPLAALLGTCVYEKSSFEKGRLPDKLRVEKTLFSEEAWGLGPGGNETDLLIYELNAEDAASLIRRAHLLKNSDQVRAAVGDTETTYYEWKRTPVPNIYRNSGNECASRNKSDTLNIEDQIFRYCHFITVDPAYTKMVNRIIASPGAYYTFGGAGSLLIVAPRHRKIVLADAG